MLCLILLDSFVDVELERKGALLCMRLRLILFLSHKSDDVLLREMSGGGAGHAGRQDGAEGGRKGGPHHARKKQLFFFFENFSFLRL